MDAWVGTLVPRQFEESSWVVGVGWDVRWRDGEDGRDDCRHGGEELVYFRRRSLDQRRELLSGKAAVPIVNRQESGEQQENIF